MQCFFFDLDLFTEYTSTSRNTVIIIGEGNYLFYFRIVLNEVLNLLT